MEQGPEVIRAQAEATRATQGTGVTPVGGRKRYIPAPMPARGCQLGAPARRASFAKLALNQAL